ncbi:MAG: hypothetical protein PV358_04100, partial [Acidimicrobiales bacterium]|nr:hypothetical protein [Acidimicrobiales bacterium]
DIANQTVDRHLTEDADMILGAASSGVSFTVIDKIVDACKIMFSPANTSPDFTDYDDDDLLAIVESLGAGNHYALDDEAVAGVLAWFAAQPRGHGFGNGRLARNLFEAAVANQATRLVAIDGPTDEQLTTLVAADIPAIET